MPNANQSAFLDFLDEVELPKRAVVNALAALKGQPGKGAQAGRNIADFLLNIPDAVLPGDLFPTLSDRNQDATVSELVGADPSTFTGRVVEGLGDVALNPISYLGMSPTLMKSAKSGATGALTAGLAKVREKAPGVGIKMDRGLQKVRQTMGWDQYPDTITTPMGEINVSDTLGKAAGIGHASTGSSIPYIRKMVGNLTEDEDVALSDAIRNVTKTKEGWRTLLPGVEAQTWDVTERAGIAAQRLAKWKAMNPNANVDEAKLQKVLHDTYAFNDRQWKEGFDATAFTEEGRQKDYLLNEYTNLRPAAASKARTNASGTDLAAFLNDPENAGIDINRSFTKSMLSRANKQSKMLRRAYLRQELGADAFAAGKINPETGAAEGRLGFFDPERQSRMRALYSGEGRKTLDAGVEDTLKQLTPESDLYHRIKYELGIDQPPPSTLEAVLQPASRLFKGAAVYGIGPFVRIGALVRNQLSAYEQSLTDPTIRNALLRDPTRGVSNIFRTIDEGISKHLLGGKRLLGDKITKAMDEWENAAIQAKGNAGETLKVLRSAPADQKTAAIRKDLADALENGAINGFVSSESAANDILLNRNAYNPVNWMLPGRSKLSDMGGAMFGALEQRMRFGSYLDLRKSGVAPAEAAKRVKGVYLDYDYTSHENRVMRTVFPFAQFVAQSIPQQAKLLANNPAYLTTATALYGGEDIPEYAREQAHLPTPTGVLGGLGSPSDVLNMIPATTPLSGLGQEREALSGIANAMHPLFGVLGGIVFGTDTFTGKPYLSDANLPFTDKKDAQTRADQMYGLVADTGLAQPFTGPIDTASRMAPKTLGQNVLRYTTGLYGIDENPILAEREQIVARLKNDPAARFAEIPYSSDAETKLDIQALKALRQRAKQGGSL